MPAKRSKSKEHFLYHKDGTIWAKGQMTDGVMTGYWEWFRKTGTIMRAGYFENGEQVGEWTTYDRSGKAIKVTRMKPKKAAAPPAKRVAAMAAKPLKAVAESAIRKPTKETTHAAKK